LSGLLTYTTNLKSYKFGVAPASDRPGGGNSKQPYIKSPIPSQDQQIPDNDLASSDFFIRGGINSARNTADDLIRLGKYFTDFRSINGPLFVAKQNSLSAIAVKTQSTGNGTGFGLNEGVYTPLSTLAQAGINFIGGHTDKQGVNPIKGVTTYSDVNQIVIGALNGEGNRLVDLTSEHEGKNSGVNVLSYSGGPNSILGVGNTDIKFATNNAGSPLKALGNEELTESYIKNQTGLGGSDTSREGIVEDKFKSPLGVTTKYVEINGGGELITEGQIGYDTVDGNILAEISKEDGITWTNVNGTPPTPKLNNPTELFIYPEPEDLKTAAGVYMFTTGEYVIDDGMTEDDGISWRSNLINPYATGTKGTLATKTYKLRENLKPSTIDLFSYPEPEDLKTAAGKYMHATGHYVIDDDISDSDGVSWGIQNYETSVYKSGSLNSSERIKDQNTKVLNQEQINTISEETKDNKNSPGSKIVNFQNINNPNTTDYSSVKTIDGDSSTGGSYYLSPGLNTSRNKTIDGINAQPIYNSSNGPKKELLEGDLIPFVIGAIDQSNPSEKEFMHFRAYIDSFNDSYSSNWDQQKYMGRGESFYKYGGFERKINLGFTVAAQSKDELIEQYKKLNFLASNVAPVYSSGGYMGGPLLTLTLGGWCVNLPGFIEGLTLDIPEESPWEIGTPGDTTRPQLPHIVKVTGFTFTPIHTFRPEKESGVGKNNNYITRHTL
tara:strand:+ start:8616 stop:10778 length:2163 start_codon:yes stop_codon:yes gene_type:complete